MYNQGLGLSLAVFSNLTLFGRLCVRSSLCLGLLTHTVQYDGGGKDVIRRIVSHTEVRSCTCIPHLLSNGASGQESEDLPLPSLATAAEPV